MRGVFNGYSINGASLPGWLVRAALVSAASAAAVVTPTRITYASVVGDASVEVTLTSEHRLAARAIGTADCASSASPYVIFAGRSTASADAVGFASVISYVNASADGDGTSYGEANPADQLGEAVAAMSSSVDLCQAHLIRPGASSVFATLADVQATGDVTRYPTVNASAGTNIGRAEASVKLSGEAFFRHDGYSNAATSSAVGYVDQDKTLLTATLGALDFGNASAQNSSFIIYSARSNGLGVIELVSASAVKTHGARLIASAEVTGQAGAVKTRPGASVALADVAGYIQATSIKQASSVMAEVAITGSCSGVILKYARVSDMGGVSLVSSTPGMQNYSQAVGFGELSALAYASLKYTGISIGDATSTGSATGLRTQYGAVDDTATSLSGLAFALSNADKPAPIDRIAVVRYESRGTEVPYENRTVVA